jgi:hypothetical protein
MTRAVIHSTLGKPSNVRYGDEAVLNTATTCARFFPPAVGLKILAIICI